MNERALAHVKNFAGHDRGVVLDQPKPGQFSERPMTGGELAAREPAAYVAMKIFEFANAAGVCYYEIWRRFAKTIDNELARLAIQSIAPVTTIDMVLFCPVCGKQHIDAPEPDKGWLNPPHRSHLCANCGAIWRPADVPTNGVGLTKTTGEGDNFRCYSGWSAHAHADGRLEPIPRVSGSSDRT